ncbi:MAG: nuclear transport factor 2 family protein [Candidatus Eremiobacteraeota bacterium]|nr:nuclear transport factor 2 family protein [Candidatus Eremiobacteraeota bacterium]
MKPTTALIFAAVLACAGAIALAADVPDGAQKTLGDGYKLTCAAALDPSDANLDAAFAILSPGFVNVDIKGKQHTRDEVVAMGKQQLKQLHVTTCDATVDSLAAQDANTLVAVAGLHIEGDIQAPDGKHQLSVTSKSQDTWKLVDGKWLDTQSKDLRNLVKVDGNVVQDEGS